MDRTNCNHRNARFIIEFVDDWNIPSTIRGMADNFSSGEFEVVAKLLVICPDCRMRVQANEIGTLVKYDVTSEVQDALAFMTKASQNISDVDERVHTVMI